MDSESQDFDVEGDSTHDVNGRYPSISSSWHYLTISILLLSVIAMLLTGHRIFFYIFTVGLVFFGLVVLFTACPYCGKSLISESPRNGKLQGKLHLIPLTKCWNCKRNIKPKRRDFEA